ncbi:MAG: hypothetical protein V3T83_03250 [Acidobacteriota bacterium]
MKGRNPPAQGAASDERSRRLSGMPGADIVACDDAGADHLQIQQR